MSGMQECVIDLPTGNWGQSDYREFSKRYFFHPYDLIEKTGKDISECLPQADPDNPTGRHAIFTKSFDRKPKVHVANRRAREISENAEYDGDIFIGLVTGYIRLTRP